MNSNISIIVATTTNLVIGVNNEIPWYLPRDLLHFKETTLNCPVIMGRKCWESIPKKYRPLPNRINIVLSRNPEYKIKDIDVSNNLIKTIEKYSNHNEIFIIGGSHIYKEGFKLASKLYLTNILTSVDGDVYLEGLDLNEWKLIKSSDIMEENGFNFRFEEYIRVI